jgi:ATP-dependent RNA helicase DDX10/DBP4
MSKSYEHISIHDFDSVEQIASDLAAMSPEDRAVQERLKSITPMKLVHHCMILKIEDKIDTLFSFLKSHQKQKILVFVSSCKQVRFLYETFRSLKVGNTLYELHGR